MTRRWLVTWVLLAAVLLGTLYVFLSPRVFPCGAPVGSSNGGQMVCPEAQP